LFEHKTARHRPPKRLADTLLAEGRATYTPDQEDQRKEIIILTAKGSTLLAEMEADFDRWSKRFVKILGKESVTHTIEGLHELKRVLNADAKHFEVD
jgi:DNA-binding MarR family transcriptional regulator